VIKGLNLLASLTPPDAAQPQPAPADDPAVFAAALVAALGLQQPVQVTVVPAQPLAPDAETTDGEEQDAEGETTAAAQAPVEGEDEGETVTPVVARITPDPDAVEESETFDRIPVGTNSRAPRPAAPVAAVKGEARPVQLERVSEEPAVPVLMQQPKQPGEDIKVADEAAVPVPTPAPQGEMAATPEGRANGEHDVRLTHVSHKRKEEQATASDDVAAMVIDRPVVTAPAAAAVAAPVAPPLTVVPDAPMSESQPPAPLPEVVATEPARERAPNATLAQAPSPAPPGGKAPPQSLQERTARAMAENVRVGRQLAELLGEETITALKLELGTPRAAGEKPAPVPHQVTAAEEHSPQLPSAMPSAERAAPVTGAVAPREDLAPKADRRTVPGTFAREAIEPVIARPFAREPVTITPLTARSEVVRMVANASLAASPNLTQTEGNPAVAKAPAPSVTPSLPDVRQELPVPGARSRRGTAEEPEGRTSRESGTSADASPSSMAAASHQPANKPADTPENGRVSREARNLPSHDSTEQKAAGSADRVTLQVADDEGRQTRIRVSVTGSQIRAVITPPDGTSARQLEQRMDQLHATLVRQGFTDPKVVVRTAPDAANDAAALAGAGSGGNQERSTVPAGRDQPAGDQRQGRGQREQDRGDGHRHPQGHSRGRDPRDRRR
jgi:hypothetical protein